MAEPSEVPAPTPAPITRQTCPDCGCEFDVPTGRGASARCCAPCQVKRMTFVPPTPAQVIPPPEPPKPWYRSRGLWLTLLIMGSLATAAVVWRKPLREKYAAWTQNLHVKRAAEGLEKKDYDRAVIAGRSALEADPHDVEANRIIAKSLEAKESTDAIAWRARLNIIRPGDVENALAWARDALKIGEIDTAEDALAVLKPADRNSAVYHDLAAKVAMGKKDFDGAKSHWGEALRLDPKSDDYRFSLATAQIRSRAAKDREAAAATFESFTGTPARSATALRILIEDAMNLRDFGRARKLADRLVALPDTTFSDQLGRLAVLRDQDAPDAHQYLEQLRDASLRNPEQLSILLDWMNQNGLPLLVGDWMKTLPAELVAKPPVALSVADALGRAHEWKMLKAFVETTTWKDIEHVRFAHLAHALERMEYVVAADQAWGRALADCNERPERLAVLVRFAQAWKMDARAESVLRKLSTDPRIPISMLDALWTISLRDGDTAELQRLSRLIVKARPKNPVARNNFIRLSLLRHDDEGTVDKLAAELFKERPDDVACAATYALSLFFHDKFFEAVSVMQAFPAEQLREPGIAFYYGVFLYAAGDFAKADEFLGIGRTATLLREENELLLRFKGTGGFTPPSPRKPTPEPRK